MPKKKPDNELFSAIWLFHVASAILYGLLFIFLATNILFAVSLPSIDPIVNGESKGVVNFMKRARTIPTFHAFFNEMKMTFSSHEQEVYKDERERSAMIIKLEDALSINPKSRDILYSLYLLYDKDGNTIKAHEYLKQAQAVDPAVGWQ